MNQNVNDVVRRTGALLDDPSNSRFTAAYLIPFIDQVMQAMDVDLEVLGMQYVEHIAIVNVASQITDLTYLLASGQPLYLMKLVDGVDWKLQGQPDTSYLASDLVTELDDVAPTSVGALEYKFTQGALQITPSTSAMVLRIKYEAISTDIYDPAQGVVRGTAHIVASRTAAMVAGLKNSMGKYADRAQALADRDWTAFRSLVVMKEQSKLRGPRPIHRRSWRGMMPMPSSGGH